MALVDTSVWIRFLANREPHAASLDGLLGKDEVAGHDLVFGELLMDDRHGRRALLDAYGQMHRASSTWPSSPRMVEQVTKHTPAGRALESALS